MEEEISAQNLQKMLSHEMSTAKELTELRETFVAFNGGQALVELLFKCKQAIPQRSQDTAARADVQFATLALLREVCNSVSMFANGLAYDVELLLHLFSLLQDRFLFDHAIILIEELLCARDDVFELALVPNFVEMVRGFDARQLLYFCRIFVVTLYEPDDIKGKPKHRTSRVVDFLTHNIASKVRTVDRNQALLVDCGFLIPRLASLLKQHKFIPNGGSSLMASLPTATLLSMLMNIQSAHEDDWGDGNAAATTAAVPPLAMFFDQASEESNVDITGDGSEEEEEEEEGDEASSDNEGAMDTDLVTTMRRAIQQLDADTGAALTPAAVAAPAEAAGNSYSLREMLLSSLQVELMFTVSALMTGKRKADVQDQLAALELPRFLQRIHASIPWVDPPGTPPPSHVHGPNCDCRPENALRVQFLRIVLNFCDRDADNIANKLLLFSPAELEEMRPLLGAKAERYQPALACVPPGSNEEGLMSKLIRFLQSGTFSEPNMRFWIGSCVEAALRGAEPAIQIFFARRGIVKYLLSELLQHSNTSNPVILQTAFDLLSECIKFNSTIFEELSTELMIGDRFDQLTRICVDRLVDSNVFVRSIILSVNASAIRNGGQPEKQFMPFAEFIERSFIVLQQKLMDAISLEDINTENLCCLNTSIVLWIFERRKGRLASSVQAVLSPLETERVRVSANFVQLLVFWREYYRLRDRDRQSLQFASTIPFQEWIETQEELLETLTGKKMAQIRPQEIVKELLLLDNI